MNKKLLLLSLLFFFSLVLLLAGTAEVSSPGTTIKQALNDVLVNLILGLISALGAAGTVLITYLFQLLRAKAKLLKYSQIDERIEQKLLKSWNDAHQDMYKGFKEQQGGATLSIDKSKETMQYALTKFTGSLSKEELKHLGYDLAEDLMKNAKNAFEFLCDASKGKLSVQLGEAARLAVGNIKSPIIGSEMSGFEIKAKF